MLRQHKFVVLLLSVALCGCRPLTTDLDDESTDFEKEAINKPVIRTIYPDGTEYVSVDNGVNWSTDGDISEKPIIFIMGDESNEYKTDSLITVKGVNISSENMEFDSEISLYYNNGEEWVSDPYNWAQIQMPDSMWSNTKKIINEFHLGRDSSSEIMTGEYRYEKVFKDEENDIYVCSFTFFII